MKTLNIQIQFNRVPKLSKSKAIALFCEVFSKTKQVIEMKIDRTQERKYINISYKTNNMKGVWTKIQKEVFKKKGMGSLLQSGSIVVCEGKNSWKDYLLLHHFNKKQKLDSLG